MNTKQLRVRRPHVSLAAATFGLLLACGEGTPDQAAPSATGAGSTGGAGAASPLGGANAGGNSGVGSSGVGGVGWGASAGAGGGSSAVPACPSEAQRAYRGTPAQLPGTVEAEDFDPAGAFDSTPGNEGAAYRTDVDVDLKPLGAGHAVGWMTAGEWLEYTVNVATAGDYQFTLKVGAVDAGRTLELSSCGTPLGAPLAVPQVSAWGETATVSTGPVRLAAGTQVLRVTVGASDFVDFDSMTVQPYDGSGGAGGNGGAGGGASGGAGSGGAASGGAGGTAATCESTYTNPVIWEDLPDLELLRVGDTYYYTASTFHYSPGAPILRSYDLIHWEHIGHSVPVMDSHPSYSLTGGRAYVNGIWASSLRYRESNKTFYWIGCMHNGGGGYVYTATSPTGPWTKHASQGCYYDVGLLVDDDDKMYVAYGNNNLYVAQLTADGFGQVRSQQVFTSPTNIGALEGSRFYKINGDYYIFTTQYANGEYVLRSTSGPFGPYTLQPFAVRVPFRVAGAGGSPHQGGIVQTQNGDWYYMAFNDAYPVGRIPVLAPVTWNNGWPSVTLVDGNWGASYPFPNLPCGAGRVKSRFGTDRFTGSTLSPEWEWNHNPDNSKWSSGAGLTLQTATVTSDLYAARNTLTQRMVGPTSTATIELDVSAMKDGDTAGLAALRDSSAWIGVKRSGGTYRVVTVSGLTLDSSWNTSSTGAETASTNFAGGKLWLRVAANVRTDAGGGQARFYYSTNGTQYTQLGGAFTMKKDWQFFTGYRFGIFNYATTALGGSVKVPSFTLASP